MISPSATRVGLTKSIAGLTNSDEPAKYYPNSSVHNFFRIVTSDELQGQSDAEYAFEHPQGSSLLCN